MAELSIQTISPGNGAKPSVGNRVTAHYVGKLENGTVFDSSVARRQPLTFNLGKGEVIKGWDIALSKMSIGEKAIITCPPEYAYGKNSVGGLIPANATLIFEVELLSYK